MEPIVISDGTNTLNLSGIPSRWVRGHVTWNPGSPGDPRGWHGLHTLFPAAWLDDNGPKSVWVACYKCFGMPLPSDGPVVFTADLGSTRLAILMGTVEYYDTSKLKFVFSDTAPWKLDRENAQRSVTPLGGHLLVMEPYHQDGVTPDETGIGNRLEAISAMIAITLGHNAVFEKEYDNVVWLNEARVDASGPLTHHPGSFPRPNLPDGLGQLSSMFDAVARLPETDRARVLLSLRWFIEGSKSWRVDSFLKLWIALEVLTMPQAYDWKALAGQIQQLFSCSFEDACVKYGIRALKDLRARVVHGGRLLSVSMELLDYIEALYGDLLAERLALTWDSRVHAVLSRPGFRLDDILKPRYEPLVS